MSICKAIHWGGGGGTSCSQSSMLRASEKRRGLGKYYEQSGLIASRLPSNSNFYCIGVDLELGSRRSCGGGKAVLLSVSQLSEEACPAGSPLLSSPPRR